MIKIINCMLNANKEINCSTTLSCIKLFFVNKETPITALKGTFSGLPFRR